MKKFRKKILSLLKKTGVVYENDVPESILGSTVLWGINNCVICTQSDMIYFCNTHGMPFNKRVLYKNISSVVILASGIIAKFEIIIGNAEKMLVEVLGETVEIQKMVDYIESKITQNQTSNPAFSQADEITKFKKLLDDGIITVEEFNLKKRHLLEI